MTKRKTGTTKQKGPKGQKKTSNEKNPGDAADTNEKATAGTEAPSEAAENPPRVPTAAKNKETPNQPGTEAPDGAAENTAANTVPEEKGSADTPGTEADSQPGENTTSEENQESAEKPGTDSMIESGENTADYGTDGGKKTTEASIEAAENNPDAKENASAETSGPETTREAGTTTAVALLTLKHDTAETEEPQAKAPAKTAAKPGGHDYKSRSDKSKPNMAPTGQDDDFTDFNFTDADAEIMSRVLSSGNEDSSDDNDVSHTDDEDGELQEHQPTYAAMKEPTTAHQAATIQRMKSREKQMSMKEKDFFLLKHLTDEHYFPVTMNKLALDKRLDGHARGIHPEDLSAANSILAKAQSAGQMRTDDRRQQKRK